MTMTSAHSPAASVLLTRRRALAGLGLTAVAATLAACGSGSDGDGKITLRYLSWENEEISRPLIDAFEKANPDIKIDFSFSPPVAEYFQTLQTRIAGGQQPDVHRINPETKANLIGEGLVVDLTNEPFMENVADANKRAYETDGKVYGASFGAWAAGLAYNKDLLAQGGVSEIPQTWDEFISVCKELKEKGVTPYRENVVEIPRAFTAFMGAKYDVAGDTEAEKKIFSGESTFVKEWTPELKAWYRLYEEGIVGAEAASLTGDQLRDDFIAGNVAMYITGPWDFNKLNEAGINWGIAPVPALDGGELFVQGSPDPGFCISSKLEGEKLEAAKKFVAFFASQEGLSLAAEHQGVLVNTSDFSVEVTPQYEDIYQNYLKESKYYLCMNYWDKAPDALQIEGQAQVQQLVQGQVTVEGVGQAMDKKLASL